MLCIRPWLWIVHGWIIFTTDERKFQGAFQSVFGLDPKNNMKFQD